MGLSQKDYKIKWEMPVISGISRFSLGGKIQELFLLFVYAEGLDALGQRDQFILRQLRQMLETIQKVGNGILLPLRHDLCDEVDIDTGDHGDDQQ